MAELGIGDEIKRIDEEIRLKNEKIKAIQQEVKNLETQKVEVMKRLDALKALGMTPEKFPALIQALAGMGLEIRVPKARRVARAITGVDVERAKKDRLFEWMKVNASNQANAKTVDDIYTLSATYANPGATHIGLQKLIDENKVMKIEVTRGHYKYYVP